MFIPLMESSRRSADFRREADQGPDDPLNEKGAKATRPPPPRVPDSLRNRARARTGTRVHEARRQQSHVRLAYLAVRRVELHPQRRGTPGAFHHALVDLADLGLRGAAVVQREIADRGHVTEVGVDPDDRRDVTRDHVVDGDAAWTAIARAIAAGTHELAGI